MPLKLLSYKTVDLAISSTIQYNNKQEEHFRTLKPIYAKENLVHVKSSKITGDQRYQALTSALEAIDKNGYRRSDGQRKFHLAYITACIKRIYKYDLDENIEKIYNMYKIHELKSEVLITTPRRYGKTTSVAMFVAAFLWAIEGTTVSIYSTGKRASIKLLELVKKFYEIIATSNGSSLKPHTSNTEELCVYSKWGVLSHCFSYPSNVKISIVFFPPFFLFFCF